MGDETSQYIFNLIFLEICQNSIKLLGDDNSEAPFYKIENLGFEVGKKMMERILLKFPPHNPFSETIDIIKYICKEFWTSLFGKCIDNLKTNHKGTFILTTLNFKSLTLFQSDSSHPDTPKLAVLYLAFPCGLIRGALMSLRIKSLVTAEIPQFPQSTFQIRIQK